MVGGIIAAVIAAIAGIVGATVNAVSVKKTNEANQELYRQQVKDQRELWRETNAYNTPSAQVDRLSAAGLNPLLAATSSNTASTPNLPSIPRLEAPQWGASMQGVQNAVDEYAGFMQQMQQLNESKERENYYKAQASLARSKDAYNVLRNTAYQKGDYFGNMVAREREKLSQALIGTSVANLNLDWLQKTHDARIKYEQLKNELTESNRDLNRARKGLVGAQTTGQIWNNKYMEQTHDARVNTSRRKLDILNYQFEKLMPEQWKLLGEQKNYYNARSLYTRRKFHWLPVEILGNILPVKDIIKLLK